MIKNTTTSQPRSGSLPHRPFSKRSGTCLVALCGLLAALTNGCKQAPLCPELGNCGGDPKGDWVLAPGHGSCSEDLYIPATDTRLVMGDQPAARTPPPEPALFDWCLLLVTGPGDNIQVKPPRFYYESGPVGAASVRYDDTTGHFSAGITRTGTYTLDFPAPCMRAFGAMDGKRADPINDPNGPLVGVCKQLEVPLAASGAGEGSYRNTTCEANPADPEGCLCFFDVSETGGPSGPYKLLNGNTIEQLPATNFPQRVTFCSNGDTLQLTGADGDYLFGQRGLRTMDLVRAPTTMP